MNLNHPQSFEFESTAFPVKGRIVLEASVVNGVDACPNRFRRERHSPRPRNVAQAVTGTASLGKWKARCIGVI